MSKAIQVHVADSLDTIGYRVVEAWRRAEYDGLARDNVEVHIGFESWEMMVRTLSPPRLELLASSSPQRASERSRTR
jgi:predicted transcriptional regulator